MASKSLAENRSQLARTLVASKPLARNIHQQRQYN
jgi:hypothetical protein